jgi:hypothetical protein
MRNPITPYHKNFLATERSRGRRTREKQKLAPYKIYSLRQLDLDLEKKEASDSLYCIRRTNHILARSRSGEEGSK